MLLTKETRLLYLLVTMAAVVIIFTENPIQANQGNIRNKCSKKSTQPSMNKPHLFISDGIFRHKV